MLTTAVSEKPPYLRGDDGKPNFRLRGTENWIFAFADGKTDFRLRGHDDFDLCRRSLKEKHHGYFEYRRCSGDAARQRRVAGTRAYRAG
jgi:hypothetical protein